MTNFRKTVAQIAKSTWEGTKTLLGIRTKPKDRHAWKAKEQRPVVILACSACGKAGGTLRNIRGLLFCERCLRDRAGVGVSLNRIRGILHSPRRLRRKHGLCRKVAV
ncbi:hypothetical protein [Anaeroselena agilis]|uniref:Ribosomal protein S14 n=1 Tax=Anaeroselena agilis TaxID=3063788 RepID=A0ABU3NUY4_9FIRM|nr:hypothetical protein [Selenomonadales bacterium 4137-cl]